MHSTITADRTARLHAREALAGTVANYVHPTYSYLFEFGKCRACNVSVTKHSNEINALSACGEAFVKSLPKREQYGNKPRKPRSDKGKSRKPIKKSIITPRDFFEFYNGSKYTLISSFKHPKDHFLWHVVVESNEYFVTLLFNGEDSGLYNRSRYSRKFDNSFDLAMEDYELRIRSIMKLAGYEIILPYWPSISVCGG